MKAHQTFISRVSFSKEEQVCHTISQRGKYFPKASVGASGDGLCGGGSLGWIAEEKYFIKKNTGSDNIFLARLNATESIRLL